MKSSLIIVIIVLVFFASCAFIPGPPVPLGLGPVLDQLAPLLLICLVAFLAWKYSLDFLRRYKKSNSAGRIDETAQATVLQCYARGEITRDQFLQVLADLERKP